MIDAVVLLPSRWAGVEHVGGRWKHVVRAWSSSPRVGRVTVVDYPSYRPRRALRPGALARRAASWLEGVACIEATLPMPATRPTVLDALGWKRAGAAVEQLLGTSDGSRLVVAANPLWSPLLARVAGDRRAFDAVDDWRANTAMRRVAARVEAGYRAAAAADVVTAVSSDLARTLTSDYGLSAVVVRNGVDLRAFSEPLGDAPAGVPDQPFAVYVGHLESRLDVALVRAVASRVAPLPIVLAGPATIGVRSALASTPTVRLLGPVDDRAVPALLARATVGLLPHRVDAFTRSMDSLKLLEYLAAGLPVVSTPLPGTDAYAPHVRVAETADAFAAAVADAAASGRDPSRSAVVADCDWSIVADHLLDVVMGGAAPEKGRAAP